MKIPSFACALLCLAPAVRAAEPSPEVGSLNRPERLEWFRDLGFGLFIHWSVDSQLGTVISHSLAGASEDYVRRFYTELPATFNPRKFAPGDWAALAKLAGVRYVMFTAKHHSGFCMWNTATTDFDVAHTPFHRDIVAEVTTAFRAQGIAVGLYHSPDDFLWLWRHHIPIQRGVPEVQPQRDPAFLRYDQDQVRELMTQYGPIDLMFFDGQAAGLRELAWSLNPNLVVTRGAIATPEQQVPGQPLPGAWESCITMGTAWQYQPTNEVYKSGTDCIDLLVETRAKGGNLLLNVGPKPDGELPIEQEERLREIALWMFANRDCIYGVRPWVVTHEGDIWFTRAKGSDTLYAIVERRKPWPDGAWRDLALKSVRATAQTEVSVLGENGQIYEYHVGFQPKTTWQQTSTELKLHAIHTQRLTDARRWPNPIVLRLTHVQPALQPPELTLAAPVLGTGLSPTTLIATVTRLGDAGALPVRFEYRDVTGLDVNEGGGAWEMTAPYVLRAPGQAAASLPLTSHHTYEVRAVAAHPVLEVFSATVRIRVP